VVFDRSRYEPKTLIANSLRAMLRTFDADVVSSAEAVVLVDWFAEIERLASAGKTLAAGRAAQDEPWQGSGDRSGADWLAKRTNTTVADARNTLDTAANLASAPATNQAFRRGELSPKQADAVAAAAAADPSAESELLDVARHQSLQKLRDTSARVRAAATDPNERHQRIHRRRFWRRWTNPDGARCGSYTLTPEAAALLEAAAQPFIDTAIDHARRTGQREPFEAYAADGLVALATTSTTVGDDQAQPGPPARGGRGRRRLRDRRELIALVDLHALQRGELQPGETCEIAGVGPVPLHIARDLFGTALLRIVIRNGVDIRTVIHTGRTASAVQETAVLVRDRGRCLRPTCNRPISEIDHNHGFTSTGPTTLEDLGGLCGPDHNLKTRARHTWHRNQHGHIHWTHPNGTIEHERAPP
jgi:hypothetical protein